MALKFGKTVMKKSRSKSLSHSVLFWISEIALWLIAFAAAFKVAGDPDMGWHLANGQYTLQNWVQRGDVYSWTMPNYPWVSHEWLTEVFMVWINSATGLLGLSIIFGILIVFIFWLAARADQRSKSNSILLAIVGIAISYSIIGVRPQMLTLLGVAILLNLLFAWRRTQNFRLLLWLPVLFFVWANFHAGFASGFIILAVFGIAEFLRWIFTPAQHRKLQKVISFRHLLQLAGLSFAGLVATFINPYGWRLYEELWMTLTKPGVLNRIAEWLPINFHSLGSYNLMIGAALIIILLTVNRFKVDYTKLTLAIVFFFIALTSWRHLALLAVIILPLLAEQLEPIVLRIADVINKTHLGVIALLCTVGLVCWWQIYLKIPDSTNPIRYAINNDYPYGAIEYLKQHPTGERMFNEYNWGGYLIWQFPEKKVFIDGRMAIWETPTIKIFDDFQSLMGNHRLTTTNLLDKWDIDLVMVSPKRPINDILGLERNSWMMIYKDNQSIVWQRTDGTKQNTD